MYGHTYSKSLDQLGKDASPARGQLNEENGHFPLSVFAPENMVSRDELGNPVPCQPAHLHTQAESGAYLHGILLEFRGGVHLFIKTTIRHRVSPELIGSCN